MFDNYQPKHLATPARGNAHFQLARTATAAIMAGLLAFPGTALAATEISVDEQWYYEQASGSGSNGGTWSWDGADDMVLNNYDGGSIRAVGDLNVELVGENTITADAQKVDGYEYDVYNSTGLSADVAREGGRVVEQGELTVSGDGSLTITNDTAPEPSNEAAGGEQRVVGIAGNGVTIDGADVQVDLKGNEYEGYEDSGRAIWSKGGREQDATVVVKNGARVSANFNGFEQTDGVVATDGVVIQDSTVEIDSNGDSGSGILVASFDMGGNGAYNTNPKRSEVVNSNFSVTSSRAGFVTMGDLFIDNSDINARILQANNGQAASEADDTPKAIMAKNITLGENIEGVSVQTTDEGMQYLAAADGKASLIETKHTGAPSKYVNGVGHTEEEGKPAENKPEESKPEEQAAENKADAQQPAAKAETKIAPSKESEPEHLAKTGTVSKSASAVPATFDPVVGAGAITAAFAGVASVATAVITRRRRS